MIATPAVRGTGLARRAGLSPIRDVAVAVDPSRDRGCAGSFGVRPAVLSRSCCRARRAKTACRGACDLRPAQGRVGDISRHDSHRAFARFLLSAQATVPMDGVRSRLVAAVRIGDRPLGAWRGVRASSRRPARASVVSLRRRPALVARADRVWPLCEAGAPGGHRGCIRCATRSEHARSRGPRGKGVQAT